MFCGHFDVATLCVGGVTTLASLAQGSSALPTDSSLTLLASIVITGLVTGVVTHMTSRTSNKALMVQAAKTKEETTALILTNTEKLLQLKEQELELYRRKIEELELTVLSLRVDIQKLTEAITILQLENAKLTGLLSKKLRSLFTADGEVELIIHSLNTDKSS